MKVSRGIETAIEEGIKEMVFDRYRYQGGVEEQPSDARTEARSIH